MTTMKALVCHPKSDPKTLSIEDVKVPNPGAHQVLVKVQCVAQNPTDVQSFDNDAFGDTVLGCDYVGIVEQVGSDVSRLKVGDHVACLVWGGEVKNLGGYSQYCIADEKICFFVPKALSNPEAATVPLALNTSWLAFFSSTALHIDRSKGQENELLIWGGSSSVGLYALQLAKLYNFNVATVCSPRNFDLVKSAGAKHVFDYRSPTCIDDVKKALPNLEYVFDTIGNDSSSATASKAVRQKGGVLCTVRPGKAFTDKVESRVKVTDVLVFTAFNRELNYKGFIFPRKQEDHDLSAELYHNIPNWVEKGEIKPNKAKVMGGLDKVKDGFQLNRDGKISGEKLVYEL